jgi:uncharacterized protein DUF5916
MNPAGFLRWQWRTAICSSILLFAASIVVDAQARIAPPTMSATRLLQAPVVDGQVLGDDAWSGAEPATGFWQIQPDDGQPASQDTEVFVGFTDDALYIAVIAYDDDPSAIIVTDSRRDSSLDDTDSFFVVIDGLLDRQNGYVFGTNAAGLEYDGQVTNEGIGDFQSGGGGFNLNWDGIWTVRSRISERGWSTEMKIPFTTLRYGSGSEQVWGINFQRNIRRNNEVAFWAPLELNRNIYRVSEAGTVTGITPPPLRNLQVTPYILGTTQRGGELSSSESGQEFGFDIKYSLTPSLTLDATYNTDFAQVEVDDQQINLDRFNLFFPEKRPFFLENAGQFAVGNPASVEMFFSRRIGIGRGGEPIPIDGGLRLSGKIGATTNIGLLYMQVPGVQGLAPGNTFAVARVNQELPNRSAIGAIVVSRNGDGTQDVTKEDDRNETYAIDGRWGIGDYIVLQGWSAKTDTPGLDGRDRAFALKANYNSAKWLSRLDYTEVGENFNPEVGFLTRKDYRNISAFLLRRFRPKDLWGLLEIRPHAAYNSFWTFDGFQETGFLHIDSQFEFKTGSQVSGAVNFTRAGVINAFDIVDGVTIQPGTYDHREGSLSFFTNQSKPFSFSFRTTVGGSFGGNRVLVSPAIRYRIGETFSSELAVDYNEFSLPVPNGDFTANLVRLRLSYSFTPKILLQALIQYNEVDEATGTNIRFSWQQSASSGFYIVYNEIDETGVGALPTGREVIVKYSYIFDVLK